jgi:hypothetical protein
MDASVRPAATDQRVAPALTLDDIDWRAALIAVHGKRGREDRRSPRCRRSDCRLSHARAPGYRVPGGIPAEDRAVWTAGRRDLVQPPPGMPEGGDPAGGGRRLRHAGAVSVTPENWIWPVPRISSLP